MGYLSNGRRDRPRGVMTHVARPPAPRFVHDLCEEAPCPVST